jgi:hypothetical protein
MYHLSKERRQYLSQFLIIHSFVIFSFQQGMSQSNRCSFNVRLEPYHETFFFRDVTLHDTIKIKTGDSTFFRFVLIDCFGSMYFQRFSASQMKEFGVFKTDHKVHTIKGVIPNLDDPSGIGTVKFTRKYFLPKLVSRSKAF